MRPGKVPRLQALLLLLLLHAVPWLGQTCCQAEEDAKPEQPWPNILTDFDLSSLGSSENAETLKRIVKRLAPEKNGEYQIYQVFFGNADLLREWLKGAGVTGQPGVDYPALTTIPTTSFTCRGLAGGYYADLETNCQVFHICDNGRKISFLCPNGTIFQQSQLICDWWFKVDCGKSVEFFDQSQEILDEQKRRSEGRKSRPEFRDFKDFKEKSYEHEKLDNPSYDGKQNGRISPYEDSTKQNQPQFPAGNKNSLSGNEKVPVQTSYRPFSDFHGQNLEYQQKKVQSYQTRSPDKKRSKLKTVPRNQTSGDLYRVTPSYTESTTFRGREAQQFAESGAFVGNRLKESPGNSRQFHYQLYPTKSSETERARGFRKEPAEHKEPTEPRYLELKPRTTVPPPVGSTESPCEDSVESTTKEPTVKPAKETQHVAETAAFISNRGFKDSRQFYYRLLGGREDPVNEEAEKTAKTISSLQLGTTSAPCDTEQPETTTVYPLETTLSYATLSWESSAWGKNLRESNDRLHDEKPYPERFREKVSKEKHARREDPEEEQPKYGSLSPYFIPEGQTSASLVEDVPETTYRQETVTYSPLEENLDQQSVTRNDLEDSSRVKSVTEKDISPYDTSFTYKQGKVLSTLGPYVPFTKSYTQSTTPNPIGHSSSLVKSLIPKLKPSTSPPSGSLDFSSGSSGSLGPLSTPPGSPSSPGPSTSAPTTSIGLSFPPTSATSVFFNPTSSPRPFVTSRSPFVTIVGSVPPYSSFTQASSGFTMNPLPSPGPPRSSTSPSDFTTGSPSSAQNSQLGSVNYPTDSINSIGPMLSSASYSSPVTSPSSSSDFTASPGPASVSPSKFSSHPHPTARSPPALLNSSSKSPVYSAGTTVPYPSSSSTSRSLFYPSSQPTPLPTPAPLTVSPSTTPSVFLTTSLPAKAEQLQETIPPEKQHALNMLRSLQTLEAEIPLTESPREFSRAFPVGSSTLHSLALYFSTATDNFDSNETPDSSAEADRPDTHPQKLQSSVEVPSLLTKHTIQSYAELFKLNNALESAMANDTVDPEEYNEDLDIQQTEDLFGESRKENGTKLRELAQVFTHALSAYLSDPGTFKKVLTEARPTEPPYSTEELGTTIPPDDSRDRYEVLDFSDNLLTRRKLTTVYPIRESTRTGTETDSETEYTTVTVTETPTTPAGWMMGSFDRDSEGYTGTPAPGKEFDSSLTTEYGFPSTDLYSKTVTRSPKVPGEVDRKRFEYRHRKPERFSQPGRVRTAAGKSQVDVTTQRSASKPNDATIRFQESSTKNPVTWWNEVTTYNPRWTDRWPVRSSAESATTTPNPGVGFNEPVTKSPVTWWNEVTTYNPRPTDQRPIKSSEVPVATTQNPVSWVNDLLTSRDVARESDITTTAPELRQKETTSPETVSRFDQSPDSRIQTPQSRLQNLGEVTTQNSGTRFWTERSEPTTQPLQPEERRRKTHKDIQNRVAGFQNNTVVSYSNVRTYGSTHAHNSFSWGRPTSRRPEQAVSEPAKTDRGFSRGSDGARTTYRPSSRYNEETLITARSSYPKYTSFHSEEAATTVETTSLPSTVTPEETTEEVWPFERTTETPRNTEVLQDEEQEATEVPRFEQSTESLDNLEDLESTTFMSFFLDRKKNRTAPRVLEEQRRLTENSEASTVPGLLREKNSRKEERIRQRIISGLRTLEDSEPEQRLEKEETTVVPETTPFFTTPEYSTEGAPYAENSRTQRKRLRFVTTTDIPETTTYFGLEEDDTWSKASRDEKGRSGQKGSIQGGPHHAGSVQKGPTIQVLPIQGRLVGGRADQEGLVQGESDQRGSVQKDSANQKTSTQVVRDSSKRDGHRDCDNGTNSRERHSIGQKNSIGQRELISRKESKGSGNQGIANSRRESGDLKDSYRENLSLKQEPDLNKESSGQKDSISRKDSQEQGDQRDPIDQGKSITQQEVIIGEKDLSNRKSQKDIGNRKITPNEKQSVDQKEPSKKESTPSPTQRITSARQSTGSKDSTNQKEAIDNPRIFGTHRQSSKSKDTTNQKDLKDSSKSSRRIIASQRQGSDSRESPGQKEPKEDARRVQENAKRRQEESLQKESKRREPTRLSNDHWTSSPEVTQLWRTAVFVDPSRINQGLDSVEEPTTTEKSTTPFFRKEFSSWWISGDEPTSFTLLPARGLAGEATPKPLITTRSSITTTITSSVTATNAVPSDSFRSLKSEPGNGQRNESNSEQPLGHGPGNETERAMAKDLFGGLNASSTSTLMNVMKQADRNETVRQLVLLLISRCREPANDTWSRTEKDQLLDALLRTPVNHFSTEESRTLVSGLDRLHIPTVRARFAQLPGNTRRYRTTTEADDTDVADTEAEDASDNRALELLRSLYTVAGRWS